MSCLYSATIITITIILLPLIIETAKSTYAYMLKYISNNDFVEQTIVAHQFCVCLLMFPCITFEKYDRLTTFVKDVEIQT